MQKYLSNDVFLNKNLIINNNFFKNAILIKSPWNETEGIWFPIKMIDFKRSRNPRYMAVTIKYNEYYRIYQYKGFSVCQVKEIRGETLIEGYETMKKNNSRKFYQELEKEKNINNLPKIFLINESNQIEKNDN